MYFRTGPLTARSGRWLACIAVVLSLASMSAVAIDPMQFDDPAKEQRYRELIAELRCMVCQNQNLADSNAPLAQDLRRLVAERIRQGHSNARIKDFLVERYSEFVLYRPRVESKTWLLWFGPFLILAAGAGALLVLVRRRRSAPAEADPESEAEHT